MNQMQEIERYRESKGLQKADMARLFNVPLQNYNNWVYRNSLPKEYFPRAAEILGVQEPSRIYNTTPADIRGYIPLISFVQAGEWAEAVDLYEPGYAERVLPTTVPHSMATFALRVDGDSMTLPEGVQGMSFPHGMIIYVDPHREARIGDFVVARHSGNKHVTFKRLRSEEGRQVLVPLNPDRKQYPIIRDEFEIIGRVIDASWGGF